MTHVEARLRDKGSVNNNLPAKKNQKNPKFFLYKNSPQFSALRYILIEKENQYLVASLQTYG